MKGTKNKKINESIKNVGEILINLSSFIEDKIKIIVMPKKTKDKCLKKNV